MILCSSVGSWESSSSSLKADILSHIHQLPSLLSDVSSGVSLESYHNRRPNERTVSLNKINDFSVGTQLNKIYNKGLLLFRHSKAESLHKIHIMLFLRNFSAKQTWLIMM